jgi:hypothetical protein
MEFSKVKSVNIPQGEVKDISVGGVKVWSGYPIIEEVDYSKFSNITNGIVYSSSNLSVEAIKDYDANTVGIQTPQISNDQIRLYRNNRLTVATVGSGVKITKLEIQCDTNYPSATNVGYLEIKEGVAQSTSSNDLGLLYEYSSSNSSVYFKLNGNVRIISITATLEK